MKKLLVAIVLGMGLVLGFWSFAQHAGTAGMCMVGKTWVYVNQATLDNPPFGYVLCHKI